MRTESLSGHAAFDHHPTYAHLRDSAANGCEFCTFFRETILEHYAQSLRCSTVEAERSHVERDTIDAASNGTTHCKFCVGLSHVRSRTYVHVVGARGLWLGRMSGGEHIGWFKDVKPAFVHMSVPSGNV
jgi:hypothetical protein